MENLVMDELFEFRIVSVDAPFSFINFLKHLSEGSAGITGVHTFIDEFPGFFW
jgi:hypothetical protein